jgi:protein-tyrosine phosphatase
MLKNEINLPGVTNARELGGYPADGKTIRKGVLIRTGALNNAEPEAVKRLQEEFHVQMIIDFRMKDEWTGVPDPTVTGAERKELSVVEMEDYLVHVGNRVDVGKKFLWKTQDRMALFEQAYEFGMLGSDTYIGFILGERGKKAYKEFFRILLETDPDKGAVLWHCKDGKDRTGLAAMLLLYALGADRKTVLEDYMLTNEYNAQTLEFIRKKAEAADMPPRKRDALLFMSGGVVESYMTNAINTLESKYGSVREYLFKELGVDDMGIKKLKDKFLV